MRIEISTKDTKDCPGFGNAVVDLVTPGRPGKPCGNFGRRVDVFLGSNHVTLTHNEWGITLNGGPRLRARYLEARPSLTGDGPDGLTPPIPAGGRLAGVALVRFIEREIRRHVGRSPRAFAQLLKAVRKDGREEGRERARARIRKAIGFGG